MSSGGHCASDASSRLSSKERSSDPEGYEVDANKVQKKQNSSQIKSSSSTDISQQMNMRYEEMISENLYVKQENLWLNPSSTVSNSGLSNREVRKLKNSNVWLVDLLLLDKVHVGASTSLDKQFEQGDGKKEFQISKDAYMKWSPTYSSEILAGLHSYSMFEESWGNYTNEQYYLQMRQKLGETPLTLQLKPALNYETIEGSDYLTVKDGQQLESNLDWQLNSHTVWTLGGAWRDTSSRYSSEIENNKNIYSRWTLSPSNRYNFNFSTMLERYRKDEPDVSPQATLSDKFTLQFGQKFNLDDDLIASFDVWQSTITHSNSESESTREQAATVSLRKKF